MADANIPAWMQDNTMEAAAPQPSSGPQIVSPPPPPAVTASAASATSASDESDPDLPGVILTMRLVNMGVAVALIAVSVCTVLGSSFI